MTGTVNLRADTGSESSSRNQGWRSQIKRRDCRAPRGAHWFISFHDESLVEPLVNTALRDPEVCCGMRVVRIEQQATPRFGTRHTFKVGSPVLAKSKEVDGKVRHYLFSDPEADATLT